MADTEQPPAAPAAAEATPVTTSTAPIAPVAIFKKRGAKGKANLRKRPASPPPAAKDSDDDFSDFESSEDEATGQRIKRRKKNHTAAITASSRDNAGSSITNGGMTKEEQTRSNTIYSADRDAALRLDATKQDATKGSNWFDEDKEDDLSTASLLGRTRNMKGKQPKENEAQQGSEREPDGTYKGLANQASYIQKNPNAPNRKVGPIKAPSNIRTITITDMAPDVCKE